MRGGGWRSHVFAFAVLYVLRAVLWEAFVSMSLWESGKRLSRCVGVCGIWWSWPFSRYDGVIVRQELGRRRGGYVHVEWLIDWGLVLWN